MRDALVRIKAPSLDEVPAFELPSAPAPALDDWLMPDVGLELAPLDLVERR